MNFGDILQALLGVSTYQRPNGYGPKLDDPSVERIRENVGGNLALQPTTNLRWYMRDLENAQHNADAGDLRRAAQLWRSMRRDGFLVGLINTLTSGVIRLPKRFYSSPEHTEQIQALDARNGTRSLFDDMCPPSELALLAADGAVLGVGVAELVKVPGRDFPVLVRLEPEFLRYRWVENRWYYTSVAGMIPITPGDGRFVLYTPGGRVGPWMTGLWATLGRSYINKEHAIQRRADYSSKLANPARAAYSPAAATETMRAGFLGQLLRWGTNTSFELPPGWDVKIIESNGRGYEVFQAEIDTANEEMVMAITGQKVTTGGGEGFSNSEVQELIWHDVLQAVADNLAYLVNTQILPPWIAQKYGTGAITGGATVAWDVTRPKDLESEARAMSTIAAAITQLREALEPYGIQIDPAQLLTRYKIPVEGDRDGDGIADADGGKREAA